MLHWPLKMSVTLYPAVRWKITLWEEGRGVVMGVDQIGLRLFASRLRWRGRLTPGVWSIRDPPPPGGQHAHRSHNRRAPSGVIRVSFFFFFFGGGADLNWHLCYGAMQHSNLWFIIFWFSCLLCSVLWVWDWWTPPDLILHSMETPMFSLQIPIQRVRCRFKSGMSSGSSSGSDESIANKVWDSINYPSRHCPCSAPSKPSYHFVQKRV